MPGTTFKAEDLFDGFGSFEGGINGGVVPLLLPRNQLSTGLNTTVRGSYVRPRPPWRKITLDAEGDAILQEAFLEGTYQGGCFYNPDNGDESLRIAVAGRLIQITPSSTDATAIATEIVTPGTPNPPSQPQAWLWQSEKWTIWQDGLNNPIFTDETTSARSNFNSPVNFDTTVAAPGFTVPAIGSSVNIVFTDATNVVVGDIVTVKNIGKFQVLSIAAAPTISVNNLTGAPLGQTVPAGRPIYWTHIGTQLPPGRMGTYGMGRNWLSLVDGKQFVASDLVGGSSGTQAENFRDAVLEITENLFLAGGGNFTVPGSLGDIRAMRFTATLDASLGQGPLQVFTPESVFSCNAPVDRLTWQDIVNPILTQSLIANGAMSQDATINANGDILFRSLDGLRSLILARREFSTWGNVPISREVERQLSKDSTDLLGYASAINFDNRYLVTTSPVLSDRGVYWRAIVPLNFDPLSTLRGKAPSVYDSTIWSGINIFQLITGLFSNQERAFALTFNTTTNKIELYELLKSANIEVKDNGTTPIVWSGETPSLFRFPENDLRSRTLKRLVDGEIYIDEIEPLSFVDFFFWYKPDQWPCWVPWFSWRECAGKTRKQFRPRMGLGQPSPNDCDTSNNRPLREGYTFQIKFMIQGKCRLIGARFKAVTVPQAAFAKQSCLKICEGAAAFPQTTGDTAQPVSEQVRAILEEEQLDVVIMEEGGGGAILEE